MKRKKVLAMLCAGWVALFATPVAQTDSLLKVELSDSAVIMVSDTMTIDSVPVVTDSVKVVDVLDTISVDSVAVALRPLVKVDSLALIMNQVKAVTGMISDRSLLDAQLVKEVFSDTAIVNKYNRLLNKMVREYAAAVEDINVHDSVHVNPLYFRLFAPLTLYKSPVSNAMNLSDTELLTLDDSLRIAAMASGRDLRLLNELDRILLSTYLTEPVLVKMTEEELKASQSVSEVAIKNASNAVLNVETTQANPLLEVKPDLVMDMVVQKPNFWKTKGGFSTQMTESYFSPNWYQGGTNNLNLLSTLTIEANYNNKKKVQWDNKLEARVGFYQNQSVDSNTKEKLQSNQDLLRLTSKLNLKAIRNWNYTIEAQGNTQMLNHFESDEVTLKSRFLAPADASLTIGMDFKKSFKKGSISIYPGPLSYKVTYVAVRDLISRYGIEEGKKSRSDIGSKLEVNFDYKLTDNISYKTRFYYFTGRYEYVQMDWENTLNFQVSKYISTKLFFHTRFDDLVEIPHENWEYFQFKQYLMLGLNYSW